MPTLLFLAAAQAFAAAPSQTTGDGAQSSGGGGAQLIIFIVGFILIFYFLMLRPQKKQQRERQNMLDSIQRGDRIQTTGGLLGIVTAVDQKEITLRIAPEVRVKIARGAVAGVVRQTAQDSKTSLSKSDESAQDSTPEKDS
jgi:preprotein translocase subunit YajC